MRGVCAGIAVVLAVGCSSGSSKQPAAIDACRYVSEPDVSTAFGGAFTKDVTLSASSHQCAFHRTSSLASGVADFVAVAISSGTSAINTFKAAIGDPAVIIVNPSQTPSTTPPERVSGIGDAAAWLPDVSTLLVTRGDYRLDIILGGPDKNEDNAKRLATTVVARLP